MKTKFLTDCKVCGGSGSHCYNDRADDDPRFDYSHECRQCEGEGKVIDEETLDIRMNDVEDMIEGMLTRIRVTSDTLKDLSRGMFYELLPKYKHRLNIQSRALARLELYLSNLKNY